MRWALPIALTLLATAPSSAGAAGAPQVTATWVAAVTATSATLRAEVNPEGLASTYRFEYLTEAAYEANLNGGHEAFAGAATAPVSGEANLGSEASPQPALQRIEHLVAGTAYRYRIRATNTAGPVAGPARAFATQPSASQEVEACPNLQLRSEDASTALPDCRAWELVSPPDKGGGAIQGFGRNFGGDVLQAAAAGGAITYSSSASFGAEAQGAPPASQYLSGRTGAGWQTANITAATLSGAYGTEPEGVPYQLFSPDLARGLLLDGRRCGEGETCPRSYSLREAGALTPTLEAAGLRFAGGDAGLQHPVFSTCAALTPGAIEVPNGGGGCNPADPNLYEWSEGSPRLINIRPGETQSSPDAALGAQSGAVSADGSRVYWTDTAGHLYLHEAGAGRAVDESGLASFQVASGDGSVAYFLKAGKLYRYLPQSEAATDLTPGGGVEGVLGASADGSVVYYATATAIFLWDNGVTEEVASGAGVAASSDYPPATGTARVSADGAQLAFLSSASPTGYENTDQASGEPDAEVYLYDGPTARLTCASCNPTGERPLGPAAIPGAIANGAGPQATRFYKPRVLSAGGKRLFFDSSDRLLPRDSSAAEDVYEWEAAGVGSCQKAKGCVFLISSGHSSQASEFIDASESGADAFFLTADSLANGDPGSVDLYDAREGGGLPLPPSPIPCEGDACQPLPSPPEDPQPGTLVAGPPNPKPHFTKPHIKKPKKKRHRRGTRHAKGAGR